MYFLGGSLIPTSDIPSPEAVVTWLIEHQGSIPGDDTDTESISSMDFESDTDSTSDEFEDLDSSGEVSLSLWIIINRPQGYKTFFMLNSTEHKISTAHKT